MALTIQTGANKPGAMLEKLPGTTAEETRKALLKGGQTLVGEWRKSLSGPRGPRKLGTPTGTLRRSVHAGKVTGIGKSMQLAVGTAMPYAAVHEFGINKTVKVRSHSRSGGTVRSHSRHMRLPERPHARPAAKKAGPIVLRIFQKAVAAAAKKASS